MNDVQRELNLMLIYAIEGYAKIHGIPENETLDIFKRYGISDYFRRYYGVLHTQDFDENVFFAEDLIERAKEKSLQGIHNTP